MNRNMVMKQYKDNITQIEDKLARVKEKLDLLRTSFQTLRYNRMIKNYLLEELKCTEILIKEIDELKTQGEIISNNLSKTDFVLPLIKK